MIRLHCEKCDREADSYTLSVRAGPDIEGVLSPKWDVARRHELESLDWDVACHGQREGAVGVRDAAMLAAFNSAVAYEHRVFRADPA